MPPPSTSPCKRSADEVEVQTLAQLLSYPENTVTQVEWEKLGGWSNQNFAATFTLATGETRVYFIKEVMPYSKRFQNRRHELKNLRALAAYSFCPTLICIHPGRNWQVFRYLNGYKPLSADEFLTPRIQEETLCTLRALHSINLFANRTDVFQRTKTVFQYLRARGAKIKKDSEIILNLIMRVGYFIRRRGAALKPCHNDANISNFMIGQDGSIKIVDFENSGNNDVAWDLAFLSADLQLEPEQERRLVERYAGRYDQHLANNLNSG